MRARQILSLPSETENKTETSILHDPVYTRALKIVLQGFPGGAAVESPPADARDTGSCPGPGRSHMPRSGWAREPWPLSLRVRSLCSGTGEATTVRGPRTTHTQKTL